MRGRRVGAAAIAVVVMAGLLQTVPPPAGAQDGAPVDAPPGVGLCVGLRGNGPRVFAHFGALARIAESTGPVECAAGGSSGSITAFLVESTLANPLLTDCGGRACSTDETAQRQALLFRTMGGLTEVGVFGEIRQLLEVVDAIDRFAVGDLLASGLLSLFGVALLTSILDQAGRLISDELGEAIRTSPDPVATAVDIVGGLARAVTFQPVDGASFVRPGPIDFAELGELIGRAGGFYAGYDPVDSAAMGTWLDECAPATVGLTFAQSRDVVAGSSSRSCADRFVDLYGAYRAASLATPDAPDRLADPIGEYAPVLASTGVLTGAAVTEWESARERYRLAELPVEFTPDFDDVAFGVFGAEDDLARVEAVLASAGDLGAAKTVPLYRATWREILGSSPAEPGLSAGVPLSNGMVSVGGWADPLRVQVADALGADPVIAVNRRDGLGAFTVSIASALGADPSELQALYGLSVTDSNFQIQLAEADAVLCSDWDTPGLLDVPALFADGFDAPLLTEDTALLAAVPTAESGVDLVGCTPGLTTPAPSATHTVVPTVGLTAGFDASGSTPGIGTVLQYRWDFGDGTTATTATPTTVHRYASPGTYATTVTVTNSNGSGTTSAALPVTVAPQSVELRFAGLGYVVLDAELDGAVTTGPTESRDRITGGGTFTGRTGGVATLSVDLERNALFDRWSGTVRVEDPAGGFVETTRVNLAPLVRRPDGVRLAATWLRPGPFLPVLYTLTLGVR